MAIGSFGTVRPSDILVSDLEVFYTFSPDRENVSNEVFRLVSTDVIQQLNSPADEQIANEENLMEGLYNITLPADTFNVVGIYNIFIRPKVIKTTIIDCGVLSSDPTIKGIILNSNDLDAALISNNALQGYRIEYIDSDGNKQRNLFRIITTSNKAIPVTENIGNTSQTAVRYRFDDLGNLLFAQVTPSSSSNVKPNSIPFIGSPGQSIRLINTNVDPVMIEVELVEDTIETIAAYVGGEQIKDVDNGIVTIYDKNRNILAQFDLFEIQDDITNQSLFEVKQKRTNIDESQDFDNITDTLDG